MGRSDEEYYKCAECRVPTNSVERHTPVEANNNIRIDRSDCRLLNAVMNVPLSKHYAKLYSGGYTVCRIFDAGCKLLLFYFCFLPLNHFPTLAKLYQKLFTGPAVNSPLILWRKAGP